MDEDSLRLVKMKLLLKEKLELEDKLRTINQQIRDLRLTNHPETRKEISDILGCDYECAGVIQVDKTYLNEESNVETVDVRFIYDCADDKCLACKFNSKIHSPFEPMTHVFSVVFSVCCEEMLDIIIGCDDTCNSDFEGGMSTGGPIDFGWDSSTFNTGPVVIHPTLGPVHELQYMIYKRWYDQWKQRKFHPLKV
jgi:hypothetical protein